MSCSGFVCVDELVIVVSNRIQCEIRFWGGGLFSKWMSIVCLVDGLSGVGLGFKRDKSGYDEGFGFQILDSFKQITFG